MSETAAPAPDRDDPGAVPWDTFVSYRHADRQVAHQLAVALGATQLVVFFDEKGIQLGADWEETIGATLRVARSCIVLIGPTGVGGVQADEVRLALARQEADPDFPLIVVLLPGAKTDGFFEPYVQERSHLELHGPPTSEDVARIADAVRGLGLEMPTGPPRSNPYPGLRPFDAATAAVFHGRERETADVLARALHGGLVTVVGPSGTGKSSLLLAGVVPALAASTPPATVVTMRPGERPRATATALLTDDGIGDDGLAALVAARAGAVVGGGGRFVLVVDQFEEIVTRTRDDGERTWFLDGIAALAEAPPPGVTVLAGVRSDRLGALNQHERAGAAVARSTYLLGPLEPAALRAAIERPAWSQHVGLEPGLADAVIADLRGQPNALPLLAVTLWAMWDHRRGDRLTTAAYQAVGRVTGALSQRADAVVGAADGRVARLTVLRLVDVMIDGAAVRRRRSLDALLPAAAAEADAVQQLLARLVDARLVLADQGPDGTATYELAHDALLSGWPWLAGAIAASRRALEQRSRLSAAVAEWERAGRVDDKVLRGAELRELSDAIASGEIAPTAVEHEFIAAGAQVARRARRRTIVFSAVAVVAAVAALVAVLAGLNLRRTADRLTGAQDNLRRTQELNAAASAQRDAAQQARAAADADAAAARAARDAATADLAAAEDATTAAEADRDAATGVRLLPDRRADGIRLVVDAARRRQSPAILQALATAVTNAPQPTTMRAFPRPNAAVVDPSGAGDSVLLMGPTAVDRCGAVDGTCAPVATLAAPDSQLRAVAVSTSGRTALVTADGTVVADDWRPAVPGARAIALDDSGDRMVVGTIDGAVRLLTRGEVDGVVVRQGASEVRRVAVGPARATGVPIALVEGADTVPGVVYLPGDGTEVRLSAGIGTVHALVVTDTYLVATDANTSDIMVWALDGLTAETPPLARLTGHEATVRSLTVRGATLVSGDDVGVVRRWDLNRRRPVGAVLPALVTGAPGDQGVTAAGLSSDGERIVVVRRDGSVDVWSARDNGLAMTGRAAPGARSLAGTRSGTVVVVDGALVDGEGTPVAGGPVAAVPAGARTAMLDDGTVVVATDAMVTTTAGASFATPAPMRVLAAGRDRAAVGLANGVFVVLDGALRVVATLPAAAGGGAEPFVATLSPDGTRLAFAYERSTEVHVVDVASGREEVRRDHAGPVTALAFSADGRTLASGADDRQIVLYEVGSGRDPGRVVGHGDKVTGLAYSSTDDVWASTSEDGTLRLWTADGVALGLPLRWGGEQLALLVAGDRSFVALGRDAVVTVHLGDWAERLCGAAGPDPAGSTVRACPR